jgi:hypothetical protein
MALCNVGSPASDALGSSGGNPFIQNPLNILAQIAQNLREINHIFLPLFQGGSPQPRGNSMFKVKIFY